MDVKAIFKDMAGIMDAIKRRKEKILNASDENLVFDNDSSVASKLHPGKIKVKVLKVKKIAKHTKKFTFTSESLPLFKAGQFMTLETKIGDSVVTRPYSIISSPDQTQGKKPIVELVIQKTGFFGSYIYHKLKKRDEIVAEIGLGNFFYEPLRDSKNIVAIASGGAITPFVSMARQIKRNSLDVNLTILYAVDKKENIILSDELNECKSNNIKIVYVIKDEDVDGCESGLVTAPLIKRHSLENSSYFICGSNDFYEHIKNQLKELHIESKRMRFAPSGLITDISKCINYPVNAKNDEFDIVVKQGLAQQIIKAKANESIAVALERAGIKIHTACLSGMCGCCQIRIEKGEYFIPRERDHRRKADYDFNYVYACSTYPLSDLTIKINIIKQSDQLRDKQSSK